MPPMGSDGIGSRLRGNDVQGYKRGLWASCERLTGGNPRALPQSLKLGARLAMFDIMASVRSWLMSMAAFQVAM